MKYGDVRDIVAIGMCRDGVFITINDGRGGMRQLNPKMTQELVNMLANYGIVAEPAKEHVDPCPLCGGEWEIVSEANDFVRARCTTMMCRLQTDLWVDRPELIAYLNGSMRKEGGE